MCPDNLADVLQTARNRELSRLAFPTGALPKYGPSMLRPEYCGKWQVRLFHLSVEGYMY